MSSSVAKSVRAFFPWAVVLGLIVACGSEGDGGFSIPSVGPDGGGKGSSGNFGNGNNEGGAGSGNKKTCADQGVECGPAGDGHGGIIEDCGQCGPGLRCGGPNAPSKCVSPTDGTGCVPK